MNGSGIPIYVILQSLMAALTPLATASGGVCTVAYDPAEAINMLANRPEGWRIIVSADTEKSAEDPQSIIGVSNSEISVIVQAGLGLKEDPALQVYQNRSGNSPSVLELAEVTRCWVRGIQFANEDMYTCPITFSWRHTAWVTGHSKPGEPTVFGRQHVFEIQHNIANPAALDGMPITLTWPS